MICPKCGYSEEERLDCRKCGVVFSKYYALHTPARVVVTEAPEIVQPPTPDVENLPAEIADLRHNFKELNRRFNDVEFERAERTRLRGEIRILDQKLKDNLEQALERLNALEQRANNPPAPPADASPEDFQRLKEELLEDHLAPILMRLEQIDARLEALPIEPAPKTDPRIIESLRKLVQRVTELDSEVANLTIDRGTQAENAPPGLEKASKDIDELRASLQNVTVRYSEIGELKKNHLILLNKVESLEHQLDRAKMTQEQAVSNRIPDIETEVHALSAEVRQTLQRTEALEALSPAPSRDIGAITEEMAGFKKMHSDRIEEVRAALELKLKKELAPLSKIFEQLTHIEQKQQLLEKSLDEIRASANEASQRITEICNNISSLHSEDEKLRSELRSAEEKIAAVLSPPPEEPRPPIEEDVHIIRETLDELRRFLSSIAQKP